MIIRKKLINVALLATAVLLSNAVSAAPLPKDVNVVNTPDVNIVNTPVPVSLPSGAIAVGANIRGADDTEGLVVSPANGSSHNLVSLTGPGTFVAARMVKQGGASGLTAVSLEIDGKIIVQRNVAALKNWGMTQNNPFGVVVFTNGTIDTVTIGFQQPIEYQTSLVLKALVNETGVAQIIGTVIHGQ